MKKLLLFLLLAGMCSACVQTNTTALNNSVLNFSIYSCVNITDINATIYAYVPLINTTTILDYNECETDIQNITRCGLNTPNLDVSIPSSGTYTNTTINSTFYCEPPSPPSGTTENLDYGEWKYDTLSSTNYTCKAFPVINKNLTLFGETWEPTDSRYNLIITAKGYEKCLQDIVWDMGFNTTETNARCNITAICPTCEAVKRNLVWNVGYNETKKDTVTNITCTGPELPKTKLPNIYWNMTGGSHKENKDWNITVDCQETIVARVEYRSAITRNMQNLSWCNKTFVVDNQTNYSVCVDNILSLCTAETAIKGDMPACFKEYVWMKDSRISSLNNTIEYKQAELGRAEAERDEYKGQAEGCMSGATQQVPLIFAGAGAFTFACFGAIWFWKQRKGPAIGSRVRESGGSGGVLGNDQLDGLDKIFPKEKGD